MTSDGGLGSYIDGNEISEESKGKGARLALLIQVADL